MSRENVRNFFIESRCKGRAALTAQEITDLFGLGRRTFQRYKSDGTFPPPSIAIGKMQRWDVETVADWYADAIERSRKENTNGCEN